MKKIYLLIVVLSYLDSYAQNVTLSSNGNELNFTKIDTLFFTEYAGSKSQLQLLDSDSSLNESLIQFDSSFGLITKSSTNTKIEESVSSGSQRIFTTSFYAYTDGILQAPTSTLFFMPENQASVAEDFKQYGSVVNHPVLKDYYYLHLNTDNYNTGDKVFALCDSFYKIGLAISIEPVFVKLLKPFSDPLFPDQWNVTNTGQFGGTPGADIQAEDAWCLNIKEQE